MSSSSLSSSSSSPLGSIATLVAGLVQHNKSSLHHNNRGSSHFRVDPASDDKCRNKKKRRIRFADPAQKEGLAASTAKKRAKTTEVSGGRLRASEPATALADANNKNAATVREFLKRFWVDHDLQKARELCSEDYHTLFGHHVMFWEDLEETTEQLFQSFPDATCSYRSLEVLPPEKGGDDVSDKALITYDFVPSGTHTGTPFAFGCFSPIEATFRHVQNDPEDILWYFDSDGKICKNEVFPKGELVGPMGFYTNIGGVPYG